MFGALIAKGGVKIPCFIRGMHMNEQDVLETLRIDGRYEVTAIGGLFYVRPISSEEIIISLSSHEECKEHFSRTAS